jgi:ketosteroid isomerase-like protein
LKGICIVKPQLALIVLLLAACSVVAQISEQKKPSGNAEQEILKLDADLFDAIWRADVAARERIAADDLIYTTHYGSALNKAEWMAHVTKPAPASSKQLRDDLRVRVSGDTAIVSGRLTIKIENPHSTGRVQSRYTNVYAKRQGEWKLLAAQVTEVAKHLRDFYNIDKESGKP